MPLPHCVDPADTFSCGFFGAVREEREEGNRCSVDKINKHSPPRENSERCSKITEGSPALASPRSRVLMEGTLDRPCLQRAGHN
ncbi:hypothetical protein EYF80_028481 [Liparis tanakae]|uniref:Uncharacterized protein n=1 Tax=Liparis tanakae TaxID=230148 RepID=A0A4Z2H5X5_9TELE|nr:hypothetical protein EYF80_028481 [Liparis tanakae]